MTQQPETIPTCTNYTVQSGDSLSLIAMKAYGDVTKWQRIYYLPANKQVIGDNPDLLQPGEKLFIPPLNPIGQRTNYAVQTGDTLQSIAERAYCDAKYWSWIWFVNRKVIGSNSHDVHQGQVLFISEIPGHGSGHTTAQECETHTIQPGDSLWLMADEAYGDGSKWQWIYDYNKGLIGEDPDIVVADQHLFIPHQDPITQSANYTVQTGDTLQSIAERAYCDSTAWTWIYDWPENKQVIGDNPDLLQPGQVLFIPSSLLYADSGGGSGHTT